MGKKNVEAPPEGLWWADDIQDFLHGNRDKLNWRMMIVFEPDWLTAEMFTDAVGRATAEMGEPPASLLLESYHEGLSAQIMHIGPNSGIGRDKLKDQYPYGRDDLVNRPFIAGT